MAENVTPVVLEIKDSIRLPIVKDRLPVSLVAAE